MNNSTVTQFLRDLINKDITVKRIGPTLPGCGHYWVINNKYITFCEGNGGTFHRIKEYQSFPWQYHKDTLIADFTTNKKELMELHKKLENICTHNAEVAEMERINNSHLLI